MTPSDAKIAIFIPIILFIILVLILSGVVLYFDSQKESLKNANKGKDSLIP